MPAPEKYPDEAPTDGLRLEKLTLVYSEHSPQNERVYSSHGLLCALSDVHAEQQSSRDAFSVRYAGDPSYDICGMG